MNAEKIDLLLARAKSLAQIGDWNQAYFLLRGNYKWVVASLEEDMGSLHLLLRYTQALCFAARGAKIKLQFQFEVRKRSALEDIIDIIDNLIQSRTYR